MSMSFIISVCVINSIKRKWRCQVLGNECISIVFFFTYIIYTHTTCTLQACSRLLSHFLKHFLYHEKCREIWEIKLSIYKIPIMYWLFIYIKVIFITQANDREKNKWLTLLMNIKITTIIMWLAFLVWFTVSYLVPILKSLFLWIYTGEQWHQQEWR